MYAHQPDCPDLTYLTEKKKVYIIAKGLISLDLSLRSVGWSIIKRAGFGQASAQPYLAYEHLMARDIKVLREGEGGFICLVLCWSRRDCPVGP